MFSFTDFAVSDILFLLIVLSAFVIFDASERVYFPADQRHTIGSYSRSRLPDSICSGTASGGRSRSFRLEEALSRFDALRMRCGHINYSLVAVGPDPFKSNGELAA